MMSDRRGGKEFTSMHRHGFVRVATSTPRVRTADVAFNRDAIIDEARRADAAHVDLLVFPELCVSSYAIDDLLLQSALLDAVEDAVGEIVAASADLRRCCWSARRCGTTGRLYNCALAIIAGQAARRGAEELTCPTTANTTRSAGSRPAAASPGRRSASAGEAVPFGTDLIFAAERSAAASCFTSRSARTSGRRSRRRPQAALAGATILANLSASNITIGKSDERAHALPLAVGARRRGLCLFRRRARREHHRPRLGRPGDDLRARRPAGRIRALPAGRRSSAIADVDTGAHPRRADAHADLQRRRRGASPAPRPRSGGRASSIGRASATSG